MFNMDNQQGDLSALRSVMASRGMNTGILDQQVGGAPGAQPANVPPRVQPQGAPMPQAQGAMPPAQSTAPTGTGLPAGDPEAQTIIKALSARLNTLGKLGR